jgi:hypothetical protein
MVNSYIFSPLISYPLHVPLSLCGLWCLVHGVVLLASLLDAMDGGVRCVLAVLRRAAGCRLVNGCWRLFTTPRLVLSVAICCGPCTPKNVIAF